MTHREKHRLAVAGVALIWFFFLGGLGCFFPFFSLYLREQGGLDGVQVGLVMAVAPLVGILSQPFWGYVADRTGRRVEVLVILAAGTAAGYAGLWLPGTFGAFLGAAAGLAFFSTGLMPILWSVTLASVPPRNLHAVGAARVCGTIGFGLSVALLPVLLRHVERAERPAAGVTAPGLELIFPCAAVLVLGAALVAALLPRPRALGVRAARGDLGTLLRQPAFLRVLAVAFGAFLCTQGPTSLFPLLVRARGGGVEAISGMWLIMLSLEVPLVAAFGFTAARLGVRAVMMLGVTAAAVRWLVSGFCSDLAVVTAAQALHGVTVWGILLGAPAYVEAVVPERLRSTGQGLLAMVSFGLGSVLSSVAAGWLTDAIGPAAPARFGGLGALLLAASTLSLLPRVPSPGAARAAAEPPPPSSRTPQARGAARRHG